MRAFWTLYRFEWKKLLGKTYVRVVLVLMVTITLLLNLRPLIGERSVAYLEKDGTFHCETVSTYQAIQLERNFAEESSGRLLENELALAMRKANLKYQEVYRTFAPEESCILLNYALIFQSLAVCGINPMTLSTDALADFAYETMEESQRQEWCNQQLTLEETAYWTQERSRIETPFVLSDCQGYAGILDKVYWINLMLVIFALVSLCSSFSDDVVFKVNPLLASTPWGRGRLVLARLAAGEGLVCGAGVLLLGITVFIQGWVYGLEGFHTPMQLLSLHLSGSSRALSAGQALLLTVGICLLISCAMAALSMLLSELFGKGVPALALPMGLLVLSLVFDVTFYHQSRVRAQIWSYLPVQRLSETFLLDERLVSVGSIPLDSVAMTVFLYGGMTLLAFGGCIILRQRRMTARL